MTRIEELRGELRHMTLALSSSYGAVPKRPTLTPEYLEMFEKCMEIRREIRSLGGSPFISFNPFAASPYGEKT